MQAIFDYERAIYWLEKSVSLIPFLLQNDIFDMQIILTIKSIKVHNKLTLA